MLWKLRALARRGNNIRALQARPYGIPSIHGKSTPYHKLRLLDSLPSCMASRVSKGRIARPCEEYAGRLVRRDLQAKGNGFTRCPCGIRPHSYLCVVPAFHVYCRCRKAIKRHLCPEASPNIPGAEENSSLRSVVGAGVLCRDSRPGLR